MGRWLPYLTPSLQYLPTYQHTNPPIYLPSHLPTLCLPIQHSYLPPTYLPTYIPTYQYIHNFIRIVPIVPHPIFSGSHCSSFRSELKSVPVSFGTHLSPFRSVSVPIEVRFGIFVGPFRSAPVRIGPFRSVSVSRDTAENEIVSTL